MASALEARQIQLNGVKRSLAVVRFEPSLSGKVISGDIPAGAKSTDQCSVSVNREVKGPQMEANTRTGNQRVICDVRVCYGGLERSLERKK